MKLEHKHHVEEMNKNLPRLQVGAAARGNIQRGRRNNVR